MTYTEACAFLYSLERRGVRLGLDRIVGALRERGDPQESFGSVLVGGTNGKGSVCAFTASCLQAAGHRTGLFTSPHLIDFRERMRFDGRMIAPEEVVDLTARIRGSIEKWHLSFFEATTLMAFLWFRDRGVEVAAVEVGLGGRLDATRPVRALVTVVTTIGLDHVRILGETRRAIAGEKAGILRHGVPLVLGVSSPEALETLCDRAKELSSPTFERRRCLRTHDLESTRLGERFTLSRRADLPGPEGDLHLEIAHGGRHQVANAALAVLALHLIPRSLEVGPEAMQTGIARVRWPGRFERLCDSPGVTCDVAHNLDGARALVSNLQRRGLKDVQLVVGMVDGKDALGFLRRLRGCVSRVYYCSPATDRAMSADRLAAIGDGVGLRGQVHGSPVEAFRAALSEARSEGEILVTGSFFTVGEVLRHIGRTDPDPLWETERTNSRSTG